MEGNEPSQIMPRSETAKTLREIADAIECGVNFNIHVNGRRVAVPRDARFEINLETGPARDPVEIEMRWDRRKGQ